MHYNVIKKFQNNEALLVVFTVELSGGIKKFIIKQQKPESNAQYTMIVEAAMSRISEEMGIFINRVRILSPNLKFELKPYPGYPATLHTFIEGTPSQVKELYVWQDTRESVPVEQRGLTLKVITEMSKNETLPPLVAFDTFIGNPDRKGSNIFYCKGLNQYIGLDLGDSLQQVAKYAVNNVKKLLQDQTQSHRWFKDYKFTVML